MNFGMTFVLTHSIENVNYSEGWPFGVSTLFPEGLNLAFSPRPPTPATLLWGRGRKRAIPLTLHAERGRERADGDAWRRQERTGREPLDGAARWAPMGADVGEAPSLPLGPGRPRLRARAPHTGRGPGVSFLWCGRRAPAAPRLRR